MMEFYISYDDFIQYFPDVAICVPYKLFLSKTIKIEKDIQVKLMY